MSRSRGPGEGEKGLGNPGSFIRCREVDWRTKWEWGLLFLSSQDTDAPGLASQADQVRQVERWINTLRVTVQNEEKPSLLHALILYYIKEGRYRQALEELETYLPSYPYLLSASLHTYAGLLAFYLAQPASHVRQRSPSRSQQHLIVPGGNESSPSSSPRSSRSPSPSPVPLGWDHADFSLMGRAKGWFAKSLEIDEKEEVAKEFLRMIDHPAANDGPQSDSGDDMGSERDESEASDGSQRYDLNDEYEFS
ncbi:hypothetical protein L198_03246 [Cryptococcus wingfieldii CBS 7118]|uniref:Uncharacterized protein n=1 Tax=Cryptococcus wingfieldii CBS 7118 TaxID=1295528 RepID=A0A1E3JEY8_9TREE|nr:hypothetical protein L198_03246 [Cryptococcus wingfieldii CBS 7118]ODN99404.1 hypothetical protein L198_03246 [Cryptococcus wingfieldii CBS 7118]